MGAGTEKLSPFSPWQRTCQHTGKHGAGKAREPLPDPWQGEKNTGMAFETSPAPPVTNVLQ